MEVGFGQQRLAKLCNSDQALHRKFGAERARRIERRLTQLAAATCLEDLRNAPGRCHVLTGTRGGQLSLDLDGPYRLILVPADPQPAKDDGGLDWSAVTAVTIIEITDTHEN